MTEMVERVARAIYEAQVPWRTGTADSDVNPFARASYDLANERMREHLRIMAAAAIAAMREPTEAMLAQDTRDWGEFDTYLEKNRQVWQAMIDVALGAE